ncbi:lymphocyte antigen 75 precursor [Aphelenchoides avenae]|nr:lymphocyte antigen 75 precursor [Aphelenchus avenae]
MDTSQAGRWLSDDISSFYYDDAAVHQARDSDNEELDWTDSELFHPDDSVLGDPLEDDLCLSVISNLTEKIRRKKLRKKARTSQAAPATYYKGLLVAVVVTAIALAVAAVAWRFPAKEKNDWICIEKLGHCYKASCLLDRSTFFEAQNECELHDANLTSIHTRVENNYIAGMIANKLRCRYDVVWIGLTRGDDVGWHWIDGTEFETCKLTTKLLSLLAYISGNEDDCTVMNANGKWLRRSCGDSAAAAVCKKPLISG